MEVELPAEALDRLVGNHRLPGGQVYVVSREGTKPFIQPTGGPKLELAPESGTEFFFRSADAQAIFALGRDGKPTALRLRMGGQEMQLTPDR